MVSNRVWLVAPMFLVAACSGSASSANEAGDETINGGQAATASETRVGLATLGHANFASLSSALGGVTARRSYGGNSSPPPASFAESAAGVDPGLGVTTSVSSFKSDPRKIAHGDYDTSLASLAKTSPAGTKWVFWHEPEGPGDMPGATDNERADAFTAAAAHVATVMKAANPEVRVGVIFTIGLWWQGQGHDPDRWTSVASGSGRTPLPIDFIGLDGYNSFGINGRPWRTAEETYGLALDWLDANRPSWGKHVTELGSTADPKDPNHRAEWITDCYSYLRGRGVWIGAYWSTNLYDISNDAAAVRALREINLASK